MLEKLQLYFFCMEEDNRTWKSIKIYNKRRQEKKDFKKLHFVGLKIKNRKNMKKWAKVGRIRVREIILQRREKSFKDENEKNLTKVGKNSFDFRHRK